MFQTGQCQPAFRHRFSICAGQMRVQHTCSKRISCTNTLKYLKLPDESILS